MHSMCAPLMLQRLLKASQCNALISVTKLVGSPLAQFGGWRMWQGAATWPGKPTTVPFQL